MCMQNLRKLAEDRALAELADFELTVPNWLETIIDDDVYYTITLATVSADSFAIGLCLGWLLTL